jgi:hypothetical protein
MNAYFWRTGENVVHHMRADSAANVRERIAAIHGDEVARRAIITSINRPRIDESTTAAA